MFDNISTIFSSMANFSFLSEHIKLWIGKPGNSQLFFTIENEWDLQKIEPVLQKVLQ